MRFIIEERPQDKKRWMATNVDTGQVHRNTSRTRLFNVLVKECVEYAKGMTQAELTFRNIGGRDGAKL